MLKGTLGVDLGYRGHGIKEGFHVIHPRLRLSRLNRFFVRAHSKIEATFPFKSAVIVKRYGFTCSMSRKGNCWDNAVAESFFHLLEVKPFMGRPFERGSTLCDL